MINVSNEFKTTMTERTDFKPSALFSFQDGRTLTLTDKDFSISNNIVTDGAESRSFPLGVAVGRSIQLEITNYEEQYSDYDFNMAVIRLKLNFQLSDTVESIDFGKYTVTEPESYGSTIIVQAVDDMYKANKNYDTALNFPASLGSLVTDSCRTCGIDIQTAAFKNDDFLVQKKPENITHRQFLALAAMLAGGYARMNRQGRLCINTYDLSGFEENPEDVDIKTVTPAENYHIFTLFTSSPSIATDDVVITGIRTQDENDKEYFFGEEGYVLEIDNQLIEGMEETAISLIGEIIVGLRFRPFTADHIAYPVAEFGDLCYVVDRNKNIYQSILTDICFTFYGITTLKCAADSPLRNSSKMNSEAVKAVMEAKKNTEKLLSAYDIAVQTMNQLAANTMGFFSTTVRQPDGSVIAYRHDKPTLAESKVVYKSGIDGFWVTQDFQGTDEATEAAGKWSSGLDSSGNAVLNILSVIGINFDWARGGAISIEDESGTPIFYANMDTKEVNISGDTVTIGGKKAPEAIEEALEEAKKARNLNMILDNEYQGIPADAEGNIDPFPEVQTGVQVFYGNTDISVDCSYSIVKSDSVTGNWDNTRRVYTVTGLAADTGWVDITASYLSLFSVTKRFNIQKVKDGAPGKDGAQGIPGSAGEDGQDGTAARTYFIEPSATVLKRSQNNTISPNFIEFKAFYRDGNSAERTAYAGRFKIEETTDGNTWNTLYTSSSNEASVRHELYSAVATAADQVIVNENNNYIGVPRDVIQVRCTLYEAGGMTNAMDIQSVAVVTDVAALTHEEIFNLLTNNGEIKGIYKEGNQLYISFTYAKGGVLSLGGKTDGNGRQEIFNAKGALIGYIDNTGLNMCGNDGKPITRVVGGKIIQFTEYNKSSDGKETFKGIAFGRKGIYFTNQDIEGWNTSDGVVTEEIPESEVTDEDGEGIEIEVKYIRFISYPKEFDVTNALENIRTNSISVFKRMYVSGESEFWTAPKLYNLSHVTSGGHLVMASDGATIAYLASSSRRYKDHIGEMSAEKAGKLLRLPVVEFKYKDGYLKEGDPLDGKLVPGFYAEDAEKIDPVYCQYNENGEVEDWNYRTMIPAMLKLIQNQNAEIESLKKEINEMKQIIAKGDNL